MKAFMKQFRIANGIKKRLKKGWDSGADEKNNDWLEVREDSNEERGSMGKRYEVRLVSWSENISVLKIEH